MKDPKLPFQEGDPVIFLDRKQRVYYSVLLAGKKTDIRGDMLPHDAIIGRTEGFLLRSQRDIPFWVFRPTINEHVVNMPRGATVIYPKDLGIILQYADRRQSGGSRPRLRRFGNSLVARRRPGRTSDQLRHSAGFHQQRAKKFEKFFG
jgi:hypothetical protein